MKILELKETLHMLSMRMDVMGEYMSEPEDRAMKIIQYG